MAGVLKTVVASYVLPSVRAQASGKHSAWRAINIMNFIRPQEPRENIDLIKPVREQMALIKAHAFPAAWLLQYDALVEGPLSSSSGLGCLPVTRPVSGSR